MALIYRNSMDRRVSGRAGAISSPLTARTGTDGVIPACSFSSPTQVLTSATASFTGTDVGRPIRLTSTPGSCSTYTITGGSGVETATVNTFAAAVLWVTSDTVTATNLAAAINGIGTVAVNTVSGTFSAGDSVTWTGGGAGYVSVTFSGTGTVQIAVTAGTLGAGVTVTDNTGGNSGHTCVTTGVWAASATNVHAQAYYNKIIVSATIGGQQTYATTVSGTGAFVNRTSMLDGNTYDGLYIIDAVNSSTSVNLRVNHNVTATGAVTSPARFMEAGNTITWYMPICANFAGDAAGDFANYTPGSYVIIEGDTNQGNNGIWQISHRVDSQNVTIAKSWFFTVPDYTTTTAITLDDPAAFVSATGLRWSLTDRQSIDGADTYEMIHQFLVDAGWQHWQNRGPNNAQQILRDNIYRSTGEAQTGTPDGKLVYLRVTMGGTRNSYANYTYCGINFSGYLSWDCTLVPEYWASHAVTSKGSGNAGLGTNSAYLTNANRPDGIQNASAQGDISTDTLDLATIGRGKTVLKYAFKDVLLVGDRDEVAVATAQSGSTTAPAGSTQTPGGWGIAGFGWLQYIGQNPNVAAIAAVTGSGANASVNTGTTDLSTKGYSIGDNVTIRGVNTVTSVATANTEYLETVKIASFSGSSPNFITGVSTLSRTYGNGTDTLLGQIGEDPFPWFQWNTLGAVSSGVPSTIRVHNTSGGANTSNSGYINANSGSPGKDYSNTQFAGGQSDAVQTYAMIQSVSTFAELSPNRNSGKQGLSSIQVKNTTAGEFRGRSRRIFFGEAGILTIGKKLLNESDGNVYILVQPESSTPRTFGGVGGYFVGPIPKTQAGLF